jgi:hypothetical protein
MEWKKRRSDSDLSGMLDVALHGMGPSRVHVKQQHRLVNVRQEEHPVVPFREGVVDKQKLQIPGAEGCTGTVTPCFQRRNAHREAMWRLGCFE